MTTLPDSPLVERLTGVEVHVPGSPGYDAARLPWNVAVDQRPAAVAVPRTVDQVREVVRAAADLGLRVAPQNTGHGASALADQSLDGVVLLRLAALTGVEVDPDRGRAHVVGGTTWQEVVHAAAAHGLTAAHGSAPDIAVAGYVLNGGLSFYGRRHGLASNAVRSVDVVTADGELHHASETENADLFWGIRGGGGNLGIVVGLELDLLPYGDIVGGMLLWDIERAADVLTAWRDWAGDVPDTVTTALRLMRFPPLPDLPPFLSGREVVVIDGALLVDDPDAADLLAPLRALTPEVDTFGRIPAVDLLQVHMDPPTPTPVAGDHCLLDHLDDAALAAFHQGFTTGGELMFAELRHLGGSFAEATAGSGALARLPGAFALLCVAVTPTPQAVVAGRAAAFGVVRALAAWRLTTLAPTLCEARVDGNRFFDGDDWTRLCRLRDELDPHRTLLPHHAL